MAQAAGPFLDFPFAIAERGLTATTDDDDHVRDLIRLVLFTSPGERVNRPEFGCGIRQLVFAPASEALAAATEQLVHGALLRWLEPVVAVEKVAVTLGEATLEVSVAYTRRHGGERRVDVFRTAVPA